MKKNLFTALAVGLCITANLMAQVPSYVPTNGLVGWWPFNGNANDESGNGNNGTVNGATLTADRFGNNSKSYSFMVLMILLTLVLQLIFQIILFQDGSIIHRFLLIFSLQ